MSDSTIPVQNTKCRNFTFFLTGYGLHCSGLPALLRLHIGGRFATNQVEPASGAPSNRSNTDYTNLKQMKTKDKLAVRKKVADLSTIICKEEESWGQRGKEIMWIEWTSFSAEQNAASCR